MTNESAVVLPSTTDDGSAPRVTTTDALPGLELYAHSPADLPADPESLEFIARLKELKKSYRNRPSFNFMVCDELARRRIAPNGSTVLRIGKWGSAGDVHGDVSDWYGALSQALDRSRAKIPPQAMASANALFEQLWTIASQQAVAPYQERIEELTKKLANAEAVLSETTERATSLADELGNLTRAHAEVTARADSLQGVIDAQLLEHETARLEWERTGAIQMEAAALRLEECRAAAERREEELRVRAHEAQTQQAEDARSYREAVARLSDEISAVRMDAAQQVDRARQDTKDANSRAHAADERVSQARAVEAELRDQIASAAVESARREMVLSAKEAQTQELLAKIDEIQAELGRRTSPPTGARRRKD